MLLTGMVLAATSLGSSPAANAVKEAQDDVFTPAKWLRDPVFQDVPVIDFYHDAKGTKHELSGPQNVHTLFRKDITLAAKPAKAELLITGDDYYKFYINGDFVVQGPEPGYPFAHPYYALDITDALIEGDNLLAVHAYYQGLLNRVWNSADNRAGFIMKLDVTYPDGATETFVTDETWRMFHLDAYKGDRTFGYKTQFAEDIDMRLIPKGWRDAGFDDSQWGSPLTGRQDHAFVQQMTPPLDVFRKDPVVAKRMEGGRYFYDFGTEITGHARIRVTGPEGHVLEVRHGEELSGPDEVRYQMRAGCTYQEFASLSGGADLIEFYDYKGFRYMEVLNAPEEPEVWVDVRHHPFDPRAARFFSSDFLLNDIWRICLTSVRYGCQGGMLDCPTREKGQYLGDAVITARSHMVLTGDPTLTRKVLQNFQQSQHVCPGMMAVAPGSFMQEIAEYSLQWPLLLLEYYRFTGDREFTEQMVDAAFPGLFGYFAEYEGEDGLLTGMNEKWVLVDWPGNLRDDYDYDYAKDKENAVLNAFYHGALMAAAELEQLLGRDGVEYASKAGRVKTAFQTRMLDPKTGLFLDAPGSSHSSLHANGVPLAFGLVEEENVPAVIDFIKSKGLNCGVYIAAYVLEGLYKAGAPEVANGLLLSDDEHSWHEMLKHGATASLEAWGPDQKGNSSWCHPWSSSPVYLIAERVMGLRPAEPGWQVIEFAPRLPEGMDHAEIMIPVPAGFVIARYDKNTGYTLWAPPDTGIAVDVLDDTPVDIRPCFSGRDQTLLDAGWDILSAHGWQERVGGGLGVWVSLDEQMFRLIQGGKVVWQARCATSERGAGSGQGSLKTPLGWHSMLRKTGEDAPWGQVFRSGTATNEVWQPGMSTVEDLVLSRVLFLTGEEPGLNKGGNVDSYGRYIYIHGTNDEPRIGTPSSHGCIRLMNDDVIEVYSLIPEGTPVLMTEVKAR